MSLPKYLFAYGTLRPTAGRSIRGLEDAGVAQLKGAQLFNLGWFPGLAIVPDSTAVVTGTLMLIDPDHYDQVLADCDAYEGCHNNSADSLYHRIKVVTTTGVETWVYTYNGDMSKRPLIESGDWFKQ